MSAKSILTSILTFVVVVSYAQSFSSKTPVSLGKGGVGVTRKGAGSVLNNPAGTARIHDVHAAINYYFPYFSKELSTQNVCFAVPFKVGVVSAYANRFGNDVFKEYKYGFNFSKSITPCLNAAFQLNLQQNYVSRNSSGNQFFSGVGVQILPRKDFLIGCFISNPEKSSLEISGETIRIPSVFIIGAEWWASDFFSIAVELEKQIYSPSITKVGAEYSINESVWLRAGMFGKPMHYTFGTGVRVASLFIDAALANHQTLGMSSSISLTFYFDRNQ